MRGPGFASGIPSTRGLPVVRSFPRPVFHVLPTITANAAIVEANDVLGGVQRNLAVYTDTLSSSGWGSIGSTSVVGTISGFSLNEVTEDNSTGQHGLQQSLPTLPEFGSGTITFSVTSVPSDRTWIVLEAVNNDGTLCRGWFNVVQGVVGSVSNCTSSIHPDNTAGFFRCQIHYLCGLGGTTPTIAVYAATADGVDSYAGDGSSVMSYMRAQVERDGATPYQAVPGAVYAGPAEATAAEVASLAKTEAADTLASAATAKIAATLSETEAADTLVAAATARIAATLSKTESADTIAATASAKIAATFSKTESADTLAATATAKIAATLNKTEAADQLAAAASVKIAASLSKTEAPDTIVSAASSSVHATLSKTEAGDTLVSAATAKINATLGVTEAADTLSSAATVRIAASLSVQEGADTLTSGSVVREAGSAGIAEAADTLSAAATAAVRASALLVESPDTLTATAIHSGVAAVITEAPDTISATATVAIAASASIQEAADTLSATATVAASAVIVPLGGGWSYKRRYHPHEEEFIRQRQREIERIAAEVLPPEVHPQVAPTRPEKERRPPAPTSYVAELLEALSKRRPEPAKKVPSGRAEPAVQRSIYTPLDDAQDIEHKEDDRLVFEAIKYLYGDDVEIVEQPAHHRAPLVKFNDDEELIARAVIDFYYAEAA